MHGPYQRGLPRMAAIERVSRRTALGAMAGLPLLAAPTQKSQLSVEGYIFEQYANEQKRPLEEIIPNALTMAQNAGYRNIELNPQFFAPAFRGRTLELLRQHGFAMPSVYVSGALHEAQLAANTIRNAVAIAELCQP